MISERITKAITLSYIKVGKNGRLFDYRRLIPSTDIGNISFHKFWTPTCVPIRWIHATIPIG